MALVGYLKIEDIKGESKRADHEDEIDIHGVNWEVKQKSSASTGSGRTQSRADISSVYMWKWHDAASPYLALSAMQGKSIPEAILMVRKDSGEAHLDYLKVTMTDCIISHYEMIAPDAHDEDEVQMIREKIGISCEKIKVVYTVQADDHSAGDEHEIEYDVVAAK